MVQNLNSIIPQLHNLSKIDQTTHFLLAENGTISPDALRLRITLGVTSLSIT